MGRRVAGLNRRRTGTRALGTIDKTAMGGMGLAKNPLF